MAIYRTFSLFILKEIFSVLVNAWQILLSNVLLLPSLPKFLMINVFIDVACIFVFFIDILRFCLLVMQEKIFETSSPLQDCFLN